MAPPDSAIGEDGPATLADNRAGAGDTPEEMTRALDGYAFGEVIGRGGIGEVVLAHDLRVGRDVAVKRLKESAPTPEQVSRFLREARIQARLGHPAIAPVYELGRDPDGRPYFTMKRLAGVTLLEQLGAPEPNRQRLLRSFTDVCLAVEFAHSRGVVHRDLKPANIMLGDFGEVYLLDWGLARTIGEAVTELVTDDIDSLDLRDGELLGTPGYMSPEQLQRATEAGPPADVYALGSILFEILAGEPLHPRGPTALASTVGGETVVSPAARRPDRAIAPELDAVCVAMLAMDAALRPTARRVATRIEAYLDGDRDLARRHTMAIDLMWSARVAVDEGRRADAMRAAGRALALDPESADAAEMVSSLVLEPPKEMPPELRDALGQVDDDGARRHARTAIGAYLALSSILPLAALNGIKRWDVVGGVTALALAMAIAAWRISRRPGRSFAQMMAYALGNAALVMLVGRMVGPFTFVPALVCVMTMSVMAYPVFTTKSWVLVATLSLGFLVPIALERAGVLASTWSIEGDALVSHARALEIGSSTSALLVGSTLAMFVVAGVDAARIYRANRDARLQLATQAWHLRHLLPVRRIAS